MDWGRVWIFDLRTKWKMWRMWPTSRRRTMMKKTTVTKTHNNCQGRMSSSRPRSRRWVINSLSCLMLPMSMEGPSCWTIYRHPSGLLRFDVYYQSMIFLFISNYELFYFNIYITEFLNLQVNTIYLKLCAFHIKSS